MEKVGLWKDEYRTGIEEIDIQHRQLFDKIERLILIAKNGDIEKNRLECNDIVDFLADYTIGGSPAEAAGICELRTARETASAVQEYCPQVQEEHGDGFLQEPAEKFCGYPAHMAGHACMYL